MNSGDVLFPAGLWAHSVFPSSSPCSASGWLPKAPPSPGGYSYHTVNWAGVGSALAVAWTQGPGAERTRVLNRSRPSPRQPPGGPTKLLPQEGEVRVRNMDLQPQNEGRNERTNKPLLPKAELFWAAEGQDQRLCSPQSCWWSSCKGRRGLALGALEEHTGSGPSEASRLPAPLLHFQPLIRIRLQPPPREPSREPGWDLRKLECRVWGREGWRGGFLHQSPSQKGAAPS